MHAIKVSFVTRSKRENSPYLTNLLPTTRPDSWIFISIVNYSLGGDYSAAF
jgi:hypothetical protein